MADGCPSCRRLQREVKLLHAKLAAIRQWAKVTDTRKSSRRGVQAPRPALQPTVSLSQPAAGQEGRP